MPWKVPPVRARNSCDFLEQMNDELVRRLELIEGLSADYEMVFHADPYLPAETLPVLWVDPAVGIAFGKAGKKPDL